MGEKKLDFNAPIMSVRRFSSPSASSQERNKKKIAKSPPIRQHSLPLYNSDWELLDEVTKPAAVPFLWEHIPGRAKGDNESHIEPAEEPSTTRRSNTPRLPPGRVLDVVKHFSDEESESQIVFRPQIEASPLKDKATRVESLNRGINVQGDSDLESEDNAYSDALDTLSPVKSFSQNCSVSCLSGYDNPDMTPSRSFSIDPQTRDFMMSRFLPAARAMVLETPEYVTKKQPVVTEQPRQVKKVISGEGKPVSRQYTNNIISQYDQYLKDAESEDKDEKDDEPGKKSGKAFGFFPRLCIKNSLCLLNPLPGMKLRTRATTSSVGEVRKVTRTAYSGPLGKQACETVYKKKFHSGVLSRELYEAENRLTGESKQFSFPRDSQKRDGLSPYSRSRAGGISPYRNEAPQSPFRDGARFLSVAKEIENTKANKFSTFNKGHNSFQDVPSHKIYKQGSVSVTPPVEKTVYIDSVNNERLPVSNSVSSEVEKIKNISRKKFEILGKSKAMEETAAKSPAEDMTCLALLDAGSILKPEVSCSLDAELPSSACTTNLRSQADRIEGFKTDEDLDQEYRSLNLRNLDKIKADSQGDSNVGSLQSPLPPPLPKSPSESWLWRTLPSVSLPNPFSHSQLGSHFHSKRQSQKTSTTGTKWETIVKTSRLHHDHVRYSEELIPYASQHSKHGSG